MGPGSDKTTSPSSSLMTDFLRQAGGVAVMAGGLATELERLGANLNDRLWSAKCLLTSPNLIRTVHLNYIEAGADIIITASYQATIQGFEQKGLSREESEALLRRSVEIALEARDIYYDRCNNGSSNGIVDGRILKHRPILIAASVGSYGAYLADGSEYGGIYGDAITKETLKNFHRRKVQVLAKSGADLIAFEATPNKLEAQAYAELLEEQGVNIPAWFSFTSNDGVNVVSGDSLLECMAIANSCKKVVAVGINCTPPRFIHGLILAMKKVTTKPILVYPNSGESYDADKKEWVNVKLFLLPCLFGREILAFLMKISCHMWESGGRLVLPSLEVVAGQLRVPLEPYTWPFQIELLLCPSSDCAYSTFTGVLYAERASNFGFCFLVAIETYA